jgi:hypothetical protein
MPVRDCRLITILSLLILTLSPLAAKGEEPLDRSFESLRLGMTLQAFQESASSIESKEIYLNLLPDERFFRVLDDALPEGVATLAGRFYHGRLYKISVEYQRDWFTEENWTRLIDGQMQRYGKVAIQKKPLRERMLEIARWEDRSSVYILQREVRMSFKENKPGNRFTVFVTYLDKPLWNERITAETEFLF